MHPLLRMLAGGDLRSTGRSARIVKLVLAKPRLAGTLVAGMREEYPVVRMRSADAMEKVTSRKPHLAQPFAAEILELLSRPQPKEVLWHLLQIAPRIAWSPGQLPKVHQVVERSHANASSIVKAAALQAEFELLMQSPKRRKLVARLVQESASSPVPALSARARKLARLMERPQQSSRGTHKGIDVSAKSPA